MTVYGRKAVLEALENPQLDVSCLHLADSNRAGGIVHQIQNAAEARGVALQHHTRQDLSRISRNGRQDQGVALDIRCPAMRPLDTYLDALLREGKSGPQRILALDGVTNPQNMGMALRSATAAGLTGVLYAQQGNPALGPLVVKASAGTVFRAPLLRCKTLIGAAQSLVDADFRLFRLQASATTSLWDVELPERALFVLGGETHGLSREFGNLSGRDLSIPMANSVESLNVAVAAALVAFAIGPNGHGDRGATSIDKPSPLPDP